MDEGVGATCSVWAIAPMCRAPSMRRAPQKSSRLLKKLPEEVELIRQAHPEAAVELWRSDEHRIGLKPILRRDRARQTRPAPRVGEERLRSTDLSGPSWTSKRQKRL